MLAPVGDSLECEVARQVVREIARPCTDARGAQHAERAVAVTGRVAEQPVESVRAERRDDTGTVPAPGAPVATAASDTAPAAVAETRKSTSRTTAATRRGNPHRPTDDEERRDDDADRRTDAES